MQTCVCQQPSHWITTETLEKKIDERKNRKAALNNSRIRSEKIRAQAVYTEANKMVKKNIRAYLNSLAVEAEEAAHYENMTAVYANSKIYLELEAGETHKIKHRASIVGEGQRHGWNISRSFCIDQRQRIQWTSYQLATTYRSSEKCLRKKKSGTQSCSKNAKAIGEKRGADGMEEGIPHQASNEERSKSVFKLQGNGIALNPW